MIPIVSGTELPPFRALRSGSHLGRFTAHKQYPYAVTLVQVRQEGLHTAVPDFQPTAG